MTGLLYAAFVLYLAGLLLVIIHNGIGASRLGPLSKAVLWLGFLLHTVALGVRIYNTGHAPMASMFETLIFYSWCTVAVSLFVALRYEERITEMITLPVASAALFFGILNFKPGGPLTLVLRTRWFETHVTASFAAYALFTLAFSAAVVSLVYDLRERDSQAARKFSDIAGRSILWGFALFSAAMFSGAIWAYLAWGVYWMWEPKVIWSFIVWFYYAGAMHAWYVKSWRGRGLSVATVIGFIIVLFTYLGVSLLMKSSHSF
ncbi:MAG: cytochrome c biogenesis protein CcsA [Proteobacteria bacterium]|nr:cytochrome c biogenesis protein CcsA [Pseudomonadota bacterium]